MLEFVLPTLLLLLPLAVWSGYRVGRKTPAQKPIDNRLSKHYFTGLNYLLNEEPDKAIDTFIELLQVDSDTVETHLALGNLFRRRGEVDRAIRIHQNLIARPSLTGNIRKLSLLELANDYMTAGLFDRAESLFKELVKDNEYRQTSMVNLVTIYQQMKEWQKAIDISRQIAQSSGKNQANKIAHYYCEIAEESYQSGDLKTAQDALKNALAVNRGSVRASIIEGEQFQKNGKYKRAIKSFRRIRHQDITFLPEVLQQLNSCYKMTSSEADLLKFLNECLQQGAGVSVLLLLSELLQAEGKEKIAADKIADYLRDRPSLKGLEQLIHIHVHDADGTAKENLRLLHGLVVKLINEKPVYRCGGCGYSGKTLFWQCPGCNEWGTIKPIFGLEGE
ncbi:MAG: lipopolysaccharide assembly protein LapB [Gammaproteobacteria bacterium]|nr:lipopolysaccharide assembly protein LapB [Gammaproteobacteria bacterium]